MDTDSIGLVVLVAAIAAVFIAAKLISQEVPAAGVSSEVKAARLVLRFYFPPDT